MNVTIQKIGEAEGIVIPKDVMTRLGWQSGDTLELKAKAYPIELRKTSHVEENDEDLTSQFDAARTLMRK